MPVWPGQFRGKSPAIRLNVSGTLGSPQAFDAVVDTGFGGFLLMSAEHAKQHGFTSGPSHMATMADGSRIALPTALANVSFANRSHQGVVTLVPNETICLVGIDFLRAFKLALIMTHEQIWLMDEREFERVALNSGAKFVNTGPGKL